MRKTVKTILLISAVSAPGGDSLEANPGVLWEYALAHSNMMHSMDNLIVSSDMIRKASDPLPDPSARFGWAPLPLEKRNGPVLFRSRSSREFHGQVTFRRRGHSLHPVQIWLF